MRKIPISKVKHLSRNGVIIVEDTDIALPNVDKNLKITKINHKSTKSQTNHSTNTWKRIEIYQTKIYIVKTALVNHSQIIQITQETNRPITLIIEVDHQNKEIYKNSHKTDIVDQIAKITSIETTIHDQIQTEENCLILGIDTIQTIDHVIHHAIGIETTQITEIEVIQITETNVIKTIDQETIPITDLIIKETITITIIGHETTQKIGIPTTTTEEIILNPLFETTIVTPIPNTNIEVTHQNISDKLIRHKQLKKQLQIPLVLTTQKVPNYN